LALASTCPPQLWPVIEEGLHKYRVILEVTERSLDRDPKTLLAGIDRHRPTVSGLALDDVGADVRTLSMLPAIEPDVIKLDLRVTHGSPSRETMKVLDYAYEEAERTGATILAEGVETERHHEVVTELGAPLAQGWLYGRPNDPPMPGGEYHFRARLGLDVALQEVQTPFEVLGGRTISRASADVILAFAEEIFTNSIQPTEPALVIELVSYPDLLDTRARQLLTRLARRGVVTGALGPGLSGKPAPGVRGSWEHDPSLDGEWAMVAFCPSIAVAVLARRTSRTGTRFEFGVTHDRQRVISAARCLLRRLGPL